MINLIKNKLRAARQTDPMVMMKDPVMGEERTPAEGDDSFKEFRKGGSKFRGNKPSMPSKPDIGSKPSQPSPEVKGSEPMEPDMGSKPPSPPSRQTRGSEPKNPEKKAKPKYNPYGTGTANPSNMSGSTGP